MSSNHTVVQGDSIASLAKKYGHLASYLWDHAENQELNELRKNPNTLLTGDVVHIPDLRLKEVDRDTEERHRFRRCGIPSKITIQLRQFGEPLAGIDYTITLDDKTVITGTTDGDGRISESVQPERTSAEISYEGRFGPKTIRMRLGHLDPITEVKGAQQRLVKLGFPLETTGELDEATVDTLKRFQKRNELEVTGENDDATQEKLLELAGS